MIASTWNYFFNEIADPRMSKKFLMKDPIGILAILGLYVLFIFKIGPDHMKNRQPYRIKSIIMIYNLLQIIYNIIIFKRSISIFAHFNPVCEPLYKKYSSDLEFYILESYYLYFLNKVFDLCDTIFFVLRKKFTHISFLHLYHHIFMVLVVWTFNKYAIGGQSISIGLCNTFVHILLYTYYFLSLFGPKIQKYLWWKKYVTSLQLIQFAVVLIHNSTPLFVDCDHPKLTVLIVLPNSILFFHLFYEFYKKNYTTSKKIRQKTT